MNETLQVEEVPKAVEIVEEPVETPVEAALVQEKGQPEPIV